MKYERKDHPSRHELKWMLARPAYAQVRDLDDFLRGTRTNYYLYFKPDKNGDLRASSRCLTPKYRRKFEQEVPGQGLRDFLDTVKQLASAQTKHSDAQVSALAHTVVAYCGTVQGEGRYGLQSTVELKAAVGRLRDAIDQAEAQAAMDRGEAQAPHLKV